MTIASWPHAFVCVFCVGFVLFFTYKVAKMVLDQHNYVRLIDQKNKKKSVSWSSNMLKK